MEKIRKRRDNQHLHSPADEGGWSVFSYPSSVPTLEFGHMLATGLKFNVGMTLVSQAVWSAMPAKPQRWLNFASFSDPNSLDTARTFNNKVITGVTAAGFGGGALTVSSTTSSVVTKETKNLFKLDDTFGLNTASVIQAIGRI